MAVANGGGRQAGRQAKVAPVSLCYERKRHSSTLSHTQNGDHRQGCALDGVHPKLLGDGALTVEVPESLSKTHDAPTEGADTVKTCAGRPRRKVSVGVAIKAPWYHSNQTVSIRAGSMYMDTAPWPTLLQLAAGLVGCQPSYELPL
jgi:hypothetical protein